jgi:hypothetical protein
MARSNVWYVNRLALDKFRSAPNFTFHHKIAIFAEW